MPGRLTCLPWALAAGASLLAQGPTLEPVLQAELAFARLADEQGIRTAFLACLEPDAQVFTPRMTSAREHYGPGPGDPGHLAWYPEAMGLAASGDLAWSLGPWTYSAKKGEAALVHGHFLSLWRRQRDGRWKVEADIGVPHPAAAQPAALVAVGTVAGEPSAGRKGQAEAQDPRPALHRLESELSRAWAVKGGSALLPWLARDARILRRGHSPLRGMAAITGALQADGPGTRWEPGRIKASRAGDLAWTCGETVSDDAGASASYLRIWILESGTWRVLFDVRVPHP